MPVLISFLSFVFVVISSAGTYAVTDDPQAVMYHTISAEQYKTITLYAHEEKAGASFSSLAVGNEIILTFPDKEKRYKVTGVSSYRAIDPTSLFSYFVNLDTGAAYGSLDLAALIYGNNSLTLQTCIERDGNKNWGRLFITAEPQLKGVR